MATTRVFSGLDPKKFPAKVPPYPTSGVASEFLYVEITVHAKGSWYGQNNMGVGDIYKVPNKLFWGFHGKGPYYAAFVTEKGRPESGISVHDCEVLPPGTVLKQEDPIYTLEELANVVGHPFKLKIEVNEKLKTKK